MTGIAKALAGIPSVEDATERDALFPNPGLWQKIENRAQGTIQRWNGASWEDVYYAGSVSSGTPAIQDEGVQVLALPQALNFVGNGVTVTAVGGVAQISVPGNGGNLELLVNGVSLGPIDELDVTGDGIDGSILGATGTIRVLGGARGGVQVVTAPLSYTETATGTAEFGALSYLLHVLSVGKCWFRLYSTAADRTADAGRAIDEDPTTPIVLDLIVDSDLDFDLFPIIAAANLDDPAGNDLYWAVQQLTPTVGPYSTRAYDNPTIAPPMADEDLNGRVPTSVGATGITAWECDPADVYFRIATYGQILPDAAATAGGNIARLNAPLDHTKLSITIDVYRRAIDNVQDACLAVLHAPGTPIGAWDYRENATLGFVRESAVTVAGQIGWTDAAGVYTVIDSAANIAFPDSTGLRFIAEVITNPVTGDGVFKLYTADYGTGANQTLVATGAVPAAIQANQYIGLRQSIQLVSGGFACDYYEIQQGDNVPVAVDLTLTRTKLEEAA